MLLDRVVRFLLPKEDHSFDLLERGADCMQRSGALLVECLNDTQFERRKQTIEKMRAVEQEADKVIVEVYESLNKTFVTPIDRSDIYHLASDLESITDDLCSIAMQIVVHVIDELPEGSTEFAALIKSCCDELHHAVSLLRGLKRFAEIREHCKTVNRLENEGDEIFRVKTAQLFAEERDAIRLIKHKEFLETLESALDVCDSLANDLNTIVIKNA